MPKVSTKRPKAAKVYKTYAKLQGLIRSFAKGDFPLLAIVGRPGLSKTETILHTMEDHKKSYLLLRGRVTPIELFEECFWASDDRYNEGKDGKRKEDDPPQPIVIDDADNLLSQPLCREYVKGLTETKKYRKLAWRSRTVLNIPVNEFHTSSPVCIIANAWNETDHILQAIESRAEFAYFDPAWDEVYRYVCGWFWDQKIADYVFDNLDKLKQPDIRLFMKAWYRKKARNPDLPWQELIDEHFDDKIGIVVRKLLADGSFPSNKKRAEEFVKLTGASDRTFYNRMREILAHAPEAGITRQEVARTRPPVEERPF